jgi:hypothetical protein
MSLWWIVLLVGVLVVWALINRSSKQLGPPPRKEDPTAPLVDRESSAPAWPKPRAEGLRRPVEVPRPAPIARPRAEAAVPPREPSVSRRTLSIELIPYPMGGKHARAVLSEEAWKVVRDIVHEEHGWQCNECPSTENLECHEEWKYDWVRRESKLVPVMQLIGLRSLCRLCHKGKHIKYVEKNQPELLPTVRRHLMARWGLEDEQLNGHVAEAVARVRRLKTRIPRELDLTYLNHARFAQVHAMMGRTFSANELHNCRETELDS